nr:hypothetical protein [Burkholderia sp. MSMB1589WGS]
MKRGFVPTASRIVSPKTSMLNLVAAGYGVAIVPERVTTLGLSDVSFVPLSDEGAKSRCALLLSVEPTILAQTFADLFVRAQS